MANTTSIFFNINRFVVLEYQYNRTDFPTNQRGIRLVRNAYNGQATVVNDNNAGPYTRNVIDNSVQELDDHRYALIDRDSAYFYPAFDPNITVDDLVISPILDPVYDVVRVHILSGYNFEDFYGFIFSIYARTTNDKILRLCNTSYIKADSGRLFFNPKPIKLSEFIYDKYFEVKIPSQSDMLDVQESTPGSTTNLSYYLTDGKYLANQTTIYCEYKNIANIIPKDGVIYLEPDETVKFAFSSIDQFDLLVAQLQQASDGDYFEYYAQYDGNIIEDYIYRLNSVAGNNFYIIHDIRLLEQIGNTFEETDNFSSIQTDKYDTARSYRPVLKRANVATSFSLEYTVRLYNSADGRSIFKTSTTTSFDVNKYGKLALKLNVGQTTQPIKVYNKVSGNPVYNVRDNLLKLTNTKLLSTYINSIDIRVQSDKDLNQGIDLTLQIVPFDNIYKFNLSVLQNPKDENSLAAFGFDDVSDYFLVFIKNDNSQLYISEYKTEEFDKTKGEIGFRLSKSQSQEVANITKSNQGYVISKNPDGIETVIFSLTWATNAVPPPAPKPTSTAPQAVSNLTSIGG